MSMTMKHIYFTSLLTIFFSMVGSKAFAYDAEIDGIYYNFSGTEAQVTYQRYSSHGLSDYSGDIIIPQYVTYNGKDYKVTSIDNDAFHGCGGLTSITIPESVTTIGWTAFKDCHRLTSIILPNSVTDIGSSAFEGTAWYDDQPQGVVYVGKVAYEYKYKDEMPEGTTIDIKEGTLGIADQAFDGCTGLISINIPVSVTSIGSNAFDGTSWYENQPDGVVYAGRVAYKYKGTMPEDMTIDIEEGTVGIAKEAFYDCTNLSSIAIPESVTSIGFGAFQRCKSLKSVNIPVGVTTVEGQTFYDCTSLTSITLPSSVMTIGQYAFKRCYSLKSINIPQSVTSIGIEAFYECGLSSIVVENGNRVYDSRNDCNALIETASNTLIKGCANTIIPEGVTTIGKKAFYYTGLSSMTIPEGIITIGESAFYNCSGLTAISIPKSVTSIGDNAFYQCNHLTSIVVEDGNSVYDSRNDCNAIIESKSNTLIIGCNNTIIPEGVTMIGNNAFFDCQGLASVIIPEGVTTINEKAFYECRGLTSVSMPNSVTKIGNNAFMHCYHLASINIPEGLTTIGDEAFLACYNLTSITIPDGVTSIGYHAFSFSGLTSITIPESVTSIADAFDFTPWYEKQPDGMVYAGKIAYKYKGIMPENTSIVLDEGTKGIGSSAFSDCSGLTSINIPDGVTNIGNGAFYGCSGLTSINIPDGVTSIDFDAFYGCSGLTSINIPENVTSIGNRAFSDCTGLTSITIPEGVTSIGNGAFYGCSSLTSITIPSSVIQIGDRAFFTSSEISSIKVGLKNPIAISSETFLYYWTATLYVPKGSKAAYEAATAGQWNECKEIVECDYMDVDNPSIAVGGSNTVEIGLNNFDSDLVAFQMDLTLPEGVSLDKDGCSLSSRITDEEQELTIGKLENGDYRLTSSSLSLTPISGTEGTLLTLKLTATEDCDDGKATISNILFSTAGSKRVEMPDETFDIDILHKFKLTYELEGEVYKTTDVIETTPLTLEAEPTKEGYTFGGWSELPETMPAHDVEVTGRFYLYGDVNTDEEVDVVDVVDIARFVVATPSDSFRERLADLNYDATVNIADAVTLVNHIAGDQKFVKAAQPIGTTYDYAQCQLLLQNAGQKALSFSLNGDADFTAFQFEVELPANTEISAMHINGLRNNGHQLIYNKVSDNCYRVAALSLSNAIFNGNKGELLNISIDGLTTDDVCIHDIHFVTINGTDVTFDSLYLSGNETGIADVDVTEGCTIYDLQGRRRNTLQRGLNIVGNKVYIKK